MWRALLEGSDAQRALERVEAIAAELDRRAPADATLARGQAGIALVHGYRARAGRDDGPDRAFAALELALAALPRMPWLFLGTAGVAFAVAHLADVIGEVGEVVAPIDELTADLLGAPRWDHSWALTDGAAGLGVYGLARGDRAIVERAARWVAAAARPDGSWWVAGDDHINLGIPHGVAGALGFLAEAGPAYAAQVRAGVAWLRGCERDGVVPRFPMHLGIESNETLDGWCYGDPATAVALVRAGHLLGEPAWIAAGHELARRAARRSDAELAHVAIDTALCHGAIGHAHLYNRLGQALGDGELLAAARRWYERALAASIADTERDGLQIGLAGIALGLLAGATAVEPAWDRALLVALPPGGVLGQHGIEHAH